MKQYILTVLSLWTFITLSLAQDVNSFSDLRGMGDRDGIRNLSLNRKDSTHHNNKIIPKGIKTWNIDERFGDRTYTVPDTASYMFMNTTFNTGLRGEYNSLGNLGSPRQHRIFLERTVASDFLFVEPYDMVIVSPDRFNFTSTLSPIANLSYKTAGSKIDGEDHFKAFFAINAGKNLGFGFIFDYLYGKGYYSFQNTSHTNYSIWGSYTGEQYHAHMLVSLNHQKVAENGGISNDAYITNPELINETYSESEIPTILTKNWNRNDNQHILFNHKYSLGFSKKVPMTEDEIKAKQFALNSQKSNKAYNDKLKAKEEARKKGKVFDEAQYDRDAKIQARPDDAKVVEQFAPTQSKDKADRIEVDLGDSLAIAALDKAKDTLLSEKDKWLKEIYIPVTSFIHTLKFDNYRRIYQAYESPTNYYANRYYYQNESLDNNIYDTTKLWTLKNTFAIALLEGFNKWAKAGIKGFLSYELQRYSLPFATVQATGNPSLYGGLETYSHHDLSIGGQIQRAQSKTFIYNATVETWLTGYKQGQLHLDGSARLKIPFLKDSLQINATAFIHRTHPRFLYTKYRSQNFWWDNELNSTIHSRIMGEIQVPQTKTNIKVGYDLIKNYTYLGLTNDRVLNGNNYGVTNTAVAVRQNSSPISILTLQVQQNVSLGIFNWDNVLTLQSNSNNDVLPLPLLNIYSNFYLRFKIAKVLNCDLGIDGRYFTKYYAAEYIPGMGSFGVQENQQHKVQIGNYPIINVYANFLLKQTRFFIMMSHVNQANGGNYFYTPHYPLNGRILRLGLSWNFFN